MNQFVRDGRKTEELWTSDGCYYSCIFMTKEIMDEFGFAKTRLLQGS